MRELPSIAEQAAAFNQGSDAHLAGEPITANPYGKSVLGTCWRDGYIDVRAAWGKERKPRIRLLCPDKAI